MKNYNIFVILAVFAFFNSACKKESDTITTTAPTNEDYVAPGSIYTITWDSNMSGQVNIKLYYGKTFISYIGSATATSGTYSWQVPSNTAEDFYYRILVESSTNGQIYDYSEIFYISSTGGSGNCDDITISIPGHSTYNNYWYTNRHIPIRWSGGSDCIVDVYYAREDGSLDLLEGSVDLGSGLGSENYYILSSANVDEPTDDRYNSHLEFFVTGISVASSNPIVIKSGVGSVSSPSFQSTLYYGNIYTITWSGSGYSSYLEAKLYKNGEYESRIESSITGSFQWMVNESSSSNDFYFIVIEDGYTEVDVAVSDIFFIEELL